MGLFKSLKGKIDVGTENPSGTNDLHNEGGSRQTQRRGEEHYAPPPGPPPSHHQQGQGTEETFEPPSGPPPSHRRVPASSHSNEEFPPPPGPPPSHLPDPKPDNPPPYHDWTVIPDTALLPPPPPLPQDYSPTNNASYDSAARAHEWCAKHPVYTPSTPSHEIHLLANAGHITLEPPPLPLRKHMTTFRQTSPTTWHVATSKHQQDAIILASIPLYFARVDNPLRTAEPKTIYFELAIRRILNANSGIAIGFAAKPYPPWRLPGWHRASVGVHGDDGRRFVNDPWGGRDFVPAFTEGQVVGVGMHFSTQQEGPPRRQDGGGGGGGGRGSAETGRVKTRAFVTRDGRADDQRWGWDIDEERDLRDEGVDGLMGEGDLYPAIGVFGGVEFDVRFGESVSWKGR
ncbi:uncharacterized protein Z520_11102 [Fonsecaea multimorphosa CBS 102226]|uniref:SPRY domain-containing protein n=1 Tax=Fonsecaea multimorphosa CBS 102226 TaxID=1442371 RepID=A0A0D2JJ78_9EURO|nr:uncharacterized protein Z520_11102 [Fonsecaea multimorphosa CBS 102226]KIX93247.1 hypothetical protein Z520_11102 [Fonsecaea multimorphosa CBS 102226]OAL18477.1 hypothetical protein AYO22_10673 [Fonsecaea multimorphosa]